MCIDFVFNSFYFRSIILLFWNISLCNFSPLDLKLQFTLCIHNKSRDTKSSSWLPPINPVYNPTGKLFLHLRTSCVSPWLFQCKVCSRALKNLMLISSFLLSLVLPVFFQAHWEIGAIVVRIIALLGISELNEISPVVWAMTFGSSQSQCAELLLPAQLTRLALCSAYVFTCLSVSNFSFVPCFYPKPSWSRTIFLDWEHVAYWDILLRLPKGAQYE